MLARTITIMCVRNTFLEDLHAGKEPFSKTGDYTDIKVTDANGWEIPWNEVSRFNNNEMKRLMQQVVNRIFTFLEKLGDPDFIPSIERWSNATERWDMPELDSVFLKMIENNRETFNK